MSIHDDTSLDDTVPSESKYLKKEDVGDGRILTIAAFHKVELERSEGGSEVKTIVEWAEPDAKPMVLNQTNKEMLKIAADGLTVGEVKGKRVRVFNDPSVTFGGKVVGGLRIDHKAPPAASKAPSDDVQF